MYGQLFSERIQGMDVLCLWPVDFAMNARQANGTRPLAMLWRPIFSGVMQTEMVYSGLERVKTSDRVWWAAQRWLCEPLSAAECDGG